MITVVLIVAFAACWGSFLSMLSYRLVSGSSLLTARSFCPSCKRTLAWYHLIPIFSYYLLAGRCAWCKEPISGLYFYTEFCAVVCALWLYIQVNTGIFSLSETATLILFLSALLVATWTDISALVISQLVTVWLVPVMLLSAYYGYGLVSFSLSWSGALAGYLFLWSLNYLFWLLTGKEGIGEGDMELLALIGATLGIVGVWAAVFVGSGLGIVYAFMQSATTRSKPFPFGPFLSLGAVYYLYDPTVCGLFS